MRATSATWEESAEILPTVNNYLSTNNVLFNSLTVFNSVSTQNQGTSNDWNSVYSTVRATSATWEESAEILPTVTNYLSTNNILVQSLNLGSSSVKLYKGTGSGYFQLDIDNNTVASFTTNGTLNLGVSGGSTFIPPNQGISYAYNLPKNIGTLALTEDLLPLTTYVKTNSAQWSGQISLSAVEQETINITLDQQSKFLTVNNTTTGTVIIPADNTVNFPAGTQVNITRLGTGVVYVSASPDVYLRSADNKKELRVQYSTATVVKLSANDWLLFGDIV